MIPVDDDTANEMLGSYVMAARVESWRDGVLLAEDIPMSSGSETVDITLNVPETVSLSVPRTDRGTVWAPGADIDHPLACWGQQLRIYVGLQTLQRGFVPVRRGLYYITDTSPSDDTITVQASGLLGLIAEAEFISPVNATGTYGSMLRQLVEPALTVDLTLAPTDRNVASSVVWGTGSGLLDAGTGRLDAVTELLSTWPAEAYVDEDGVLNVIPPGDTSTSSLTLTDGAGGTTMRWNGEVTRSGAASLVVARGYDSTGADVQAVAFDDDSGSPTFYSGPFNPLAVPFDYFSPLLTTTGACAAAANTVLMRRKRQGARRITADAVPYLALQTRDGVTVTASDLGVDAAFGLIDQLTMPLTAADGAMRLGVRLV